MKWANCFQVINNAKEFSVELNVSQFRPEELSVSVHDEELVIEGHHEERDEECGTVERHFTRKYTLPKNVNPESIESHMTKEGHMTVKAKKLEQLKVRTIPIQCTMAQKRSAEDDPEDDKPVKKTRRGKKST